MTASEFSIKLTNIKYEKKYGNKEILDFEISGSIDYGLDKSIINGIRRTLLTNVETLAFKDDNIIIKINKGSLHNEFLKHRISLIPLYIDPDTYNYNYLFVLKKKITDETILNVRSNDFEIYELKDDIKRKIKSNEDDILNKLETVSSVYYNLDKPLSDNKKEEIFKPFKFEGEKNYFLITELKNTGSDTDVQELEIYCSPSIGTSNEHSRFNNLSRVVYSFKKNPAIFKKYLEDSIKINKIKDSEKVAYSRSLELKDGERYYFKDNNNESFIYNFGITSNHIKTPKELFILSLDKLNNRFTHIIENLKLMITDPKNSQFTFTPLKNDLTYQLLMNKEDDTTGNMIQSHMVNKWLNNESLIQVCGYKKLHPLTDLIVFNIAIQPSDRTENQVKTFIAEYFIKVCNDLIDILDIIKTNSSKKLN